MRWICRTCRTPLVAERRADDAISFRCTRCSEEYDVAIVDASREVWIGKRPAVACPIDITFEEPWRAIEKDRRSVEDELENEVGESHVLFGIPVSAVARRMDCDDVLFVATNAVFVVHLTWKRARESDPAWPATERYEDLIDFVKRGMRDD